jgi:hypothetical protein
MRGELFSGRYGVVEAFAFTAIVLVDIWFLHWRNPLGDLLPACFILWSLIRHNETLQSLGLAPQQLWPALRAWRLVLLPCAAAVFIGCFLSGRPLYLLFRGAISSGACSNRSCLTT